MDLPAVFSRAEPQWSIEEFYYLEARRGEQ
jgi:hypothetical protein